MSEEKKNEILGKEKELDEGELDAVSGGSCGCVLGGGGKGTGKKSGLQYICPCPGAGVGFDKEDTTYCACPGVGGGTDKPIT